MMETAAIRAGEELDAVSLLNYLREQLPGEDARDLRISQFPAGSSNLTYLVGLDGEEFVLRRPPFGNTVKTAHDVGREFDVLSKLSAVYMPAPKPLLFCDDKSVIGSEFYLMERRHGLIIRGRTSETLNDRELQREVCRSFVINLVELHSLDHAAAGLGDLGKPAGYNRRQVEGWTKRYFAAKTDEHKELEESIEWLNGNIPAESGASLIHNDYKFDNVMLDRDDLRRITAVLDWEMVTIGDPLMDLGTTLGYWMSRDAGEEMLSMPFNPRVLMENISRQELSEMYAEASGRDVSNILFYYVFGTFKIATIAQQIFARYKKGFTRDARFARFNRFVGAMGAIAATAIEKQRI
jgi:aminoglycoside phosphotransferase (APT) family kinase protein